MRSATLIFPHQLYQNHPAIANGNTVILIEEFLYFSHYNFHKQKLVLHRASMRAYERSLQQRKIATEYIEAQEKHSDVRLLGTWLKKQKIKTVHYSELSDDWLHRRLLKCLDQNNIEAIIIPTPNFITSTADADTYCKRNGTYFQTNFYKWQRKRLHILLQPDGSFEGGRLSFDEENRSPFPRNEKVPVMHFPATNSFVKEAIAYVEKHWPNNYGSLENFAYPVTHSQAEKWLTDFLKYRFEKFGVYEDAMVANEHFLYHSVLSPLLNIGLLHPQQVVDTALQTYHEQQIPLNSVEGFIRQIIGWREFIYMVYMREGPKQRTKNYWTFHRPIPASFWMGETGILPVDTVIKKALHTGYSHHIERLMVMGNFMLLCEFDPDKVYQWFMEMYIDAYDWVMVPNTYGMTQFSDGGIMMTKPYISGSNYLLKMGDWKKGNAKTYLKELGQVPLSFGEGLGERSATDEELTNSIAVGLVALSLPTAGKGKKVETEMVPWNEIWDGLFWRFMQIHQSFFSKNPRLSLLLGTLNKMDTNKRKRHFEIAEAYLTKLDEETQNQVQHD